MQTIQRNTCIACQRKGSTLYTDLRDQLFGVSGNWSMDTCTSCKLLWLNPYPSPDSVAELYNTYYTHTKLNNSFLKDSKFLFFPKNKKIKYAILNSHYKYPIKGIPFIYKMIGFIGGYIPGVSRKVKIGIGDISYLKDGKILDIGCGNGDFLLEMNYLGWKTFGIEVDEKSSSEARANGLDVITGEINSTRYPHNFFDVIYTNNTIEHLHNPEEILNICNTILKPRGTLIIKTCSSQSLAHYVFKKNYRGLEIPRHYFIFSPYSLKKIGEQAGFLVKEIKTSFNQYIWFSSYKIKTAQENPSFAISNKYLLTILYIFISLVIFIRPDKGDDIFVRFEKVPILN